MRSWNVYIQYAYATLILLFFLFLQFDLSKIKRQKSQLRSAWPLLLQTPLQCSVCRKNHLYSDSQAAPERRD